MINTIRHHSIVPLDKLEDPALVIGAGAIGSKVVIELVKLGCTNITIVDYDIVENHNISNQYFAQSDIGIAKAEAIKQEALRHNTSANIIAKICEFDYEDRYPYKYVFICVDDMDVRRELMKKYSRSKTTKFIVEARMSYDMFFIYTVTNIDIYKKWLNVSKYSNEDTSEESACGSKISLGATSSLCAGFMLHSFINFLNEKPVEWSLTVITYPFEIITEEG
jgi:hypothetical protein